jgi:hypothetical protein
MIYDIFSKRAKRERGNAPEVYCYDQISNTLRVQIVHVLTDVLSTDDAYEKKLEESAKVIHDVLAREYGLFMLSEDLQYHRQYSKAVFDFVLKTANVERVLDILELGLFIAERVQANYSYHEKPVLVAAEGVDEINNRFREDAVGYQYESGKILRVDSQFMHQEVVKPALAVLRSADLAGANQEFLAAHEHYRNRRYKEAINECLKAFESTMKVICIRQSWNVESNATASRLIDVCFANKLVPDYLQSEFASLRSALESGIPTVRNRTSGHGQGSSPAPVPDYVAGYLLHLTAATAVFLTDAERSLS